MEDNVDPNFVGGGIYREHIMDHYKNPRNQGILKDADAKHTEHNPVCGDVITITVAIKNDEIKDLRFQGRGCAISQAATSMLTEELKGKPLKNALDFSQQHIVEMLGIPIGPVRTKCAVLGMIAVKEAIKEYQNGKIHS